MRQRQAGPPAELTEIRATEPAPRPRTRRSKDSGKAAAAAAAASDSGKEIPTQTAVNEGPAGESCLDQWAGR
ncbi:hypothetical protein GCM10010215_48350 [Streptomyces virginiae]|uniref:Transposase n=1 Tax=Streptomyces virginiae TaxID=1961 RepID=A0ABQ3NXF8_STRVG|nr:hypothetical protein GCM10010215_48350 [Streptomyces virginiae]GHI17457.1 hypothetical protein Scinn_69200 [Streptomyces virginiae]